MTNTQTQSVPEIISGLARAIWKKMEYPGDPPEGPTLSDIQEFTSVPELPIKDIFVHRWGQCYFVWQAMTLGFSEVSKNREDVPIFLATEDDFTKAPDEDRMKAWTERILDENRDDLKEWLKIQLKDPGWPHLKKVRDFNAVILRTGGRFHSMPNLAKLHLADSRRTHSRRSKIE